MKTTLALGTAFTLGLGNAYGAGICPGGQNNYLSGRQISDLVSGKTVCAQSASGGWNEAHATGGAGPVTEWHTNTPNDPTEVIGTYSITPNANGQAGTITYNAGGIFVYYVTNETPAGSGNYIYCTAIGASPGITVNVRSGYSPISGCPNNPDK